MLGGLYPFPVAGEQNETQDGVALSAPRVDSHGSGGKFEAGASILRMNERGGFRQPSPSGRELGVQLNQETKLIGGRHHRIEISPAQELQCGAVGSLQLGLLVPLSPP